MTGHHAYLRMNLPRFLRKAQRFEEFERAFQGRSSELAHDMMKDKMVLVPLIVRTENAEHDGQAPPPAPGRSVLGSQPRVFAHR